MNPKLRTLPVSVLAALSILTTEAAADEKLYQTDEYFASQGLDLINAASAYEQGYTGKGVLLGLLDTQMRSDHRELSDKLTVIGALDTDGNKVPLPTEWTDDIAHGTHVASIMAAKKDGYGMHGVAFNSDVVGQVFIGKFEVFTGDEENFYQAYPNIKILNNSWCGESPDKTAIPSGEIFSVTEAKEYFQNESQKPYSGRLLRWALENPDSLAVVAAANDGWISPSPMALLPRYYGSQLSNWLTVVSVNPTDTQRVGDKIVMGPTGLALYSNTARGAELFTVSAPGSLIKAADAVSGEYRLMSGTSMATPHVSGAAALVAEAFPWMNGKQLADVILTTANSNIECPNILVGFDSSQETVLVFYHFSDETPTEEEFIEALKNNYNANPSLWPANYSLNTLIEYFVKDHFEQENPEDDKYVRILKVTKEEIFGQGILDAGKAVKGPARLDVNRLSADALRSYKEFGDEQYVFETFDTKGYTANFSNDISERLWDDKYHHEEYKANQSTLNSLSGLSEGISASSTSSLADKKPGLIKTGSGTLVLTGTNTYSAPTVVEKGLLVIEPREDGTGGVLTNSSVLIQEDGALAGTGTVENAVINNGLFLPGSSTECFTVGTFSQGPTGQLLMLVDVDGQHNQLKILDSAAVEGTLSIGVQKGFYNNDLLSNLSIQDFFVADDEGKLDLKFEVSLHPNSPTLTMALDKVDGHYVLTSQRLSDSYSKFAGTAAEASLGNALYRLSYRSDLSDELKSLITELDFSDMGGSAISAVLKDTLPNVYLHVQKANADQYRLFNRILLSESSEEGAWIKPIADRTDRKDSSAVSGYRSTVVGALGGLRGRVAENWTAGGFLAVTDENLKEDHTGSRYDGTSITIGAEGRYASPEVSGWTVFASVLAGVSDSKVTRKSSGQSYTGKWTGYAFGAQMGTELLGGSESVQAGPYAAADYVWSHRPSVSESGGTYAQDLSGKSHGEFSTVLGLAVKARQSFESGDLSANAKAGWRHVYGSRTVKANTRLRGTSETFFAESDRYGRDSAEISMSVTYRTKGGFYVGLEAAGTSAKRTNSIGANLTIGRKF